MKFFQFIKNLFKSKPVAEPTFIKENKKLVITSDECDLILNENIYASQSQDVIIQAGKGDITVKGIIRK